MAAAQGWHANSWSVPYLKKKKKNLFVLYVPPPQQALLPLPLWGGIGLLFPSLYNYPLSSLQPSNEDVLIPGSFTKKPKKGRKDGPGSKDTLRGEKSEHRLLWGEAVGGSEHKVF